MLGGHLIWITGRGMSGNAGPDFKGRAYRAVGRLSPLGRIKKVFTPPKRENACHQAAPFGQWTMLTELLPERVGRLRAKTWKLELGVEGVCLQNTELFRVLYLLLVPPGGTGNGPAQPLSSGTINPLPTTFQTFLPLCIHSPLFSESPSATTSPLTVPRPLATTWPGRPS